MISLILFLSTTVFFPIYIVLTIIPLIFIRELFFTDKKIVFSKLEFWGYIIISIAALIIIYLNIFFGAVLSNINDSSVLGDFPYIIFLILAFLIGKFLTLKDLRLIQFFILIEVIIGVLEYIAGTPTFFRNNTTVSELNDSGILYQNRVFGFSGNSSNLATKIVYLATISIMLLKTSNKISLWEKVILPFILVGLFITFNRTAIISILISIFLLFGFKIKNLVLIIVPIIVISILKWESIIEQLTRGRGEVDLSGRDEIFNYFYSFWTENLFFGNLGTKLWWNASGSIWHSHNSYLEFLASNGFLVSIFFVIGWLFIFGRKTIIVLPIIVFSIFQYGFLWGISFYDIVIASIIYIYIERMNNKNRGVSESFKV
ncbi:hypothetical protein [Acinetobacter sp. TSRC1-2]|uniref:hypothetical protein n=1 Tax=unclassified Acinetobacter TaxID=196816 RepID=UPI003CF54DE1